MAAKKSVIRPGRSVTRTIVPLKANPVDEANFEPAPVEATEISPIEDIVAISPVLEAMTTTMADVPSIAGVMTDLKKTQTEVKSHMENTMKSTEEMVSFGQGNVEAVMKSSQIWATGMQDLSKHFAATAQAQLDETMATLKALSSVKSLKEALELQSTLAKTAMEKMMAEGGKLTDASMKLAEQAIAPITARVTLATEKFGRTA